MEYEENMQKLEDQLQNLQQEKENLSTQLQGSKPNAAANKYELLWDSVL